MPGDAISICPSRKPRVTPGPAPFSRVLRVIRMAKGYSHRRDCQNAPLCSQACQWYVHAASSKTIAMFAAFRLPHLLPFLAAANLLGALSSAAIAADVSPWDDDLQSAARLIAARAHNESGGRVFRAGIEIKLKEGWKTYWRYPGDSGVPPALDFSQSQNVKTVTVLYPAPARFPDGAGGSSIGYTGVVILPLHVVPQDAGKPVQLNLKL